MVEYPGGDSRCFHPVTEREPYLPEGDRKIAGEFEDVQAPVEGGVACGKST